MQSFKSELIQTAKDIAAPGKGILAADESTGTIGKRFEGIAVENNEENRRAYRDLLVTAPGIEKHISGVIFFEESVDQKIADGTNMTQHLRNRGIHVGIKLDKGLVVIGGTNDESATQGLDGLAARAKGFYEKGCRFAKWRAVLKIGDGRPSDLAIAETAHSLARYGSICQDNGLVPIIEPEILQDGSHSIEVCAEVSERVFAAVMKAMLDHKLIIEGCLLKPNMVTPGAECPDRKTPAEVAWMTVRTLGRTIVPALPAVTFLSGGQSEEDASLHLNAMNALTGVAKPWALTFSYGRALQKSVLAAWKGQAENVAAAQAVLLERATANGLAALGQYKGGSGDQSSQFVANYSY
jgi:fructose-bisphosphate aldolase, class I